MKNISDSYLDVVHFIRNLAVEDKEEFEDIKINQKQMILAMDYLVFTAQLRGGDAQIASGNLDEITGSQKALLKEAIFASKSFELYEDLAAKERQGMTLTEADEKAMIKTIAQAILEPPMENDAESEK